MPASHVVKDENNAVRICELDSIVKADFEDAGLWHINAYFCSNSVPAPLWFRTKAERDDFFDRVVAAMGGEDA